MDSEKPALTNPDMPPSPMSLKAVLEDSYEPYRKIMHDVCNAPFNLKEEWKYYLDGKAWLCKVTNKKKTVFWLAAYKGFFKMSFYFTIKNADDIAALSISKKIKEMFTAGKPIGKLIPLTITVKDEKYSRDILKLVQYKMEKL